MDSVFNHPWVTAVIAGFLLTGIIGKLMKFSFERIAKWYLYISAFCVLVVMDSSLFPFIGGKDYFFRFAVELALLCVALWWAFEAKAGELKQRLVELFKNPIVQAVTAFAVVFMLATFFAYDVHAAFWSNYERGEGGFQFLHYYAFFLLLVFTLREEKDWKKMFGASLIAGGLMIIYGLLANFGFPTFIGPYASGGAPAGWIHKLIDGRFQGSLGNPAYVAPYLLFSMFFAAYLWIHNRATGKRSKLVAWGWGVLIAIFLFVFILTQTRGAFIGLAVGLLAYIIYLVRAAKGNLRKWSGVALIVLVVLGGILYSIRNLPAVQNLPEGRLLQLSASDTTAQTRFWVWGEAWKGFLDRPILGWGPENFATVFDKYFDTRFFVPAQSTETWFDRAHSVFFDYLTETGILGLLTYLGIFFTLLWQFIKSGKRHRAAHGTGEQGGNATILERGLFIALPVAYLVQGAAIFDVLPMYVSLFAFLGFAAYYFMKKNHDAQTANHHHH